MDTPTPRFLLPVWVQIFARTNGTTRIRMSAQNLGNVGTRIVMFGGWVRHTAAAHDPQAGQC
jgi:hypothetical protein